MINNSIRKLVCYGIEKGLVDSRDEIYVTNRILEILNLHFSLHSFNNGINFTRSSEHNTGHIKVSSLL